MSLSWQRNVSWSTAALLVAGSASRVVAAPGLASGASAVRARLDEQSRCVAVLSRLADVGAALGYTMRAQPSGFTGSRGRDRLQAACSSGHGAIEVVEARGGQVSVAFGRDAGRAFALELVGEYPEVGSVSQTAVIADAAAETLAGSLTFVADAGEDAAFVEVDLSGQVLTEGGDATQVNVRFAPVLTASSAWRDAHALALALAESGGVAVVPAEAELDAVLAVAVPSPRSHGIKKSIIGQAMACGTATITCTVAAYGFVPAAGSCVNSAGACALSVACTLISCLD